MKEMGHSEVVMMRKIPCLPEWSLQSLLGWNLKGWPLSCPHRYRGLSIHDSLGQPSFSGHLWNVPPKLGVGDSPGEASTPPCP